MVNLFYRWTLVTVFFLFANLAFAQSQVNSNPVVSQPIKMGISQQMRDLPLTTSKLIENWTDGIIPLRSPFNNEVINVDKDGSLNEYNGPKGISAITKNFDGVPVDPTYAVAPPDQSGDVGPNHYVQMVNLRTQIWDKNGNSLAGPFNNSNFWAGLPGPWSSSNDGDPIVLYDEIANRWMVSQFALPNYPNGPFYMLIAVSTTPDPTGTYYQYAYSFANMPDYPKFGIWSDGYYMSANVFASGSGSYLGTYAAVFNRAAMLAGTAATMQYFSNSSSTWSLLPSDCDGVFPPAGAPNYFLATYNGFGGGNTNLDVYQFHVDWVTPANSTFTGPLLLTTPSFSEPNPIPQLNTTQTLDNLADRPMNRLQYRNFGSHQSMVVCQTVNAGSGRAGLRWWELRKTSGNWSIYQGGTYAPADGLYRWMGSIAIDGSGNIALGYSTSSSTIYPDIRYTGRFSSDPLGSMTIAETIIYAGAGSQTGGLSRWGDYTQMVVDPTAAGTFWYTNQYIPTNGSFNWKTRIAAFTFNVADPTNVLAAPINSSRIDVSFTPNVSNNNVVIVWNNTGTFTTPSGPPPAVGGAFAGGTLLYNGTVSPVVHAGLNPLTTYYYKLFSFNGTNYSTGVATNATTLNIANPTNVLATPISGSQIDIAFTPNANNNNVVIIWNLMGTFTVPSGPPPAIGQSFAGGTLLYNGTTSPVNHNGLNSLTTYYYKLFSYNGVNYSSGVTSNATTLNVSATFPLTVNVADGWNMVSVPGLHPTNQNVSTWWPNRNTLADAYKWTNTYVAVTLTDPGEGYWMLHTGAQTYNTGDEWPIGGIQIVAHDPIPLTAGWNMIGGYENTPLVSGLTTTPADLIVPGTVYGWTGTYENSTNLIPGFGYWVLSNGNGVINPPTVADGPAKLVAQDDKSDWGKITITDASGKSYTLYSVNGEVNLDQYQMPPLPPAGMFDVRYGSGRYAEDLSASNKTIEMNGLEYPVKVRVENAEIRLQDASGNGLNERLKSGEEVTISNSEISKLMVYGDVIPNVYALEQNYPNPFNPSTKIRYGIPKEGLVKLTVYSSLGEEVINLVEEQQQPGQYEINFNSNGIASGVYLYKISSGDFVQTRKMIILK